MVHNNFDILDEGKIKSIDNYKMKDPKYFTEFIDTLHRLKILKYDIEYKSGYDCCTGFPRASEDTLNRLKLEYDTLYDPFYEGYMGFDNLFKIRNNPQIAQFMGAMPFYPSVMINISPDWKGKFGNNPLTDKLMIKNLKKVIEQYLNESIGDKPRFTKWKYCLEYGSEGNFLHAHIVAQINPKLLASMKSHFSRNNHVQQLKKYCNKIKGMEGLIKGKYSVQRNLINTEEMLHDKLDYLIEANKCEGHQNLKDLNLVFGDY